MKNKSLKIYFNAPITLTFAFICIVALVLDFLTNGETTSNIFSTYNSSFLNPMTYVRLVCHVFGHSSWEHFFSNIPYILLLGPILEEKYGNKLIIVILFTAIITGISHNILEPNTGLLGASGIVFAFILLAGFTGRTDGIPITFILVAVLFLGSEIINCFTLDNVSQLAHIIGGLSGALMAIFLN